MPDAAATVAASEPVVPSPRPSRPGRAALVVASLRAFGRRRRALITVVGSLATAAVLALLLAGRRDEFAAALSGTAAWVLALAVVGQIVALVSRSEAWHLTIQAAGGTVGRRVLYRASSMQVLGSVVNGNLGVAARIAALRRSSPAVSPQVPTLIAAELPILAVEAALAALTSFTLVGPLGLPWWAPVVGIAVIATASAGLRHLALRKGRELWRGHRSGPQPARRKPAGRLRPDRGVRPNPAQLAAAERGRGGRLVVRCDRRAHRGGDPRSASGRSERGRCRRRAHPRRRRACGGGGGRGPHDGDGHGRRAVLRAWAGADGLWSSSGRAALGRARPRRVD